MSAPLTVPLQPVCEGCGEPLVGRPLAYMDDLNSVRLFHNAKCFDAWKDNLEQPDKAILTGSHGGD